MYKISLKSEGSGKVWKDKKNIGIMCFVEWTQSSFFTLTL